MRTRRRLTWIIFAVCILAVFEGLGWVTWHALRLERREREAQAAAQFQQSIRLALWRMESEITPIIAAEAARPYFHYISFYPAERAYTKMFQQVLPGELRVPSPLLESSGRFIRLHYQIEPDGTVTSPQAPTGNMRDLAEGQNYLDAEFIVLAGQMLDEVAAMVRPQDQKQVAGSLSMAPTEPAPRPQQQREDLPVQAGGQVWRPEDSAEYQARERAVQTAQSQNVFEQQQHRKSQAESRKGDAAAATPRSETATAEKDAFAERSASKPAGDTKPSPSAAPPASPGAPPPPVLRNDVSDRLLAAGDERTRRPNESDSMLKKYQAAGPQTDLSRVEQGSFAARWSRNPRTGDDELLLERPVQVDGRETRQGIWVDWPQLRDQLKSSVEDLLPAATLCPAQDANETFGQRLAAIPVRLLPGATPLRSATFTPTHITLLVTWLAVLGASAAIGLVLRKAMELSERRGRFVSAVTHELRTPLTTFCLYTEMLSGGMVPDEAARNQYLGTLRSESGRLARIVQNVLDYAGIGGVGRRSAEPAAAIAVADLFTSLRPTLEHCASRAGMNAEFHCEPMEGATVRTDPQTVERILLNLVENAGKYAGDSTDKRVHIRARRVNMGKSDGLEVSVRDHGPGVPKSERRMIFHAFHRATRDAQGPKAGLGLGLALAREFARELGGRLTLNSGVIDGAEFRLVLPLSTRTKY